MTKEQSHVMLESHNLKMEPLNVRKKSKGTTKYEKKIITCNVGTAQCDDGIAKCEKKKVRETPNVRKQLSHVILELHNMKIEPSSVRNK